VRPLTALLPLALTGALLSGCAAQSKSSNAKDFTGDQKSIATVIDDLSNAASDRDGKAVCDSILTSDDAAKLKQGTKTCADVVKDQLEDADVYKLDVKSIKVDGATATAVVESQFDGKDAPRTLSLVKQGNSWRIDGLT
jgi:hypothetical protein